MARKPNYKFERMERDRAKAAKKAARAKAKEEAKAKEQPNVAIIGETDTAETEPAASERAPE